MLKEHEAARWLDPDKIASVDWLPTDLTIIPAVAALLEKDAYFDRISGWGSFLAPGFKLCKPFPRKENFQNTSSWT